VFVSPRRDASAAKTFSAHAIKANGSKSAEIVTDKTSTYPGVLDEVLSEASHNTVKHAYNAIENDHGRLRARLRPMRGLKQDRSARIVIRRPRPCPEPATGSLRTRHRRPAITTSRGRLLKTGLDDLRPRGKRPDTPGLPDHRQRNSALATGAGLVEDRVHDHSALRSWPLVSASGGNSVSIRAHCSSVRCNVRGSFHPFISSSPGPILRKGEFGAPSQPIEEEIHSLAIRMLGAGERLQ
jgi:DDE domain